MAMRCGDTYVIAPSIDSAVDDTGVVSGKSSSSDFKEAAAFSVADSIFLPIFSLMEAAAREADAANEENFDQGDVIEGDDDNDDDAGGVFILRALSPLLCANEDIVMFFSP